MPIVHCIYTEFNIDLRNKSSLIESKLDPSCDDNVVVMYSIYVYDIFPDS